MRRKTDSSSKVLLQQLVGHAGSVRVLLLNRSRTLVPPQQNLMDDGSTASLGSHRTSADKDRRALALNRTRGSGTGSVIHTCTGSLAGSVIHIHRIPNQFCDLDPEDL